MSLSPAPTGLYLHIPFCIRKCPYCSFFSRVGPATVQKRFLQALEIQISRAAKEFAASGGRVTTIFFGGGTPTTLEPEQLARLLTLVRDQIPCKQEMEISIEVNPATIDARGLQILRRAGFNRLSTGIQSVSDRELALLGRPHSAAQGIQVIRDARGAGFTNISLDLMFGLPGQQPRDWAENLGRALELTTPHLSLYELTLEENTPFAKEMNSHDLPPEDDILAMMETTLVATGSAGLKRYEISNYARPGHECRHNILYWENRDYIGLGAGAVQCLGGVRKTAVRDVEAYCGLLESGKGIWQDTETLDQEARFRETMIMGLRMIRGISLSSMRSRFNIDPIPYYGSTIKRLMDLDLLEIRDGRLRLTSRGLPVANAVMAELV